MVSDTTRSAVGSAVGSCDHIVVAQIAVYDVQSFCRAHRQTVRATRNINISSPKLGSGQVRGRGGFGVSTVYARRPPQLRLPRIVT
ncbi:Uncharacterised protein [Mycobacteroides abscessus subsp. abscessus]|nr:Uncharacterised protein [Mycobacteroides abscessus subsp. abscessus]